MFGSDHGADRRRAPKTKKSPCSQFFVCVRRALAPVGHCWPQKNCQGTPRTSVV
jgi:hypothetical protein